MSDENEFLGRELPREIAEAADAALSDNLPAQSRASYEKTYNSFSEWKKLTGATETSEKVVLAYFKQLSDRDYKPPTLWTQYSKLNSMLNLKEKINIKKFLEVSCFLKEKSRGYNSNQFNVFSADQIQNFLINAPDELNLDKKVIILFGIFGALKGSELTPVTVKHVKRQGDVYHINLPKSKTMKLRSFVIPQEFTTIVEKYVKLRPISATTDRFFLNYQKGKCTIQPIGKNKIAAVPHKIAEFLNLPNPKSYTAFSFRRTSETMLINVGSDLTMLKRAGVWKSFSVAEIYIDESTVADPEPKFEGGDPLA